VTLFVAASSVALGVRPAYADTPAQENAGATQEGQSVGKMTDDTMITAKVKAAFVKDEKVSALRIKVTTNNGIVQLSGFANSAQEADRAAEVARNVAGVKDVKSDIQLKAQSKEPSSDTPMKQSY
jgi:hyperosmotically inducible protein